MKLLLTSNGLSNKSISNAFVGLVGKSAEDIKVAFVPTAAMVEPGNKDWLINDLHRIYQLGCYIDIVDIAQLSKEEWLPRIEVCDVIFVGGGYSFYLSYMMQRSGLFEEMSRLLESKVYVGISSGSMIMGQSLVLSPQDANTFQDEDYEIVGPKDRSSSKTFNYVNFIFRPHFNSLSFPKVNQRNLEEKAKNIIQPIYALDDESALKIVGDKVEVISEGSWVKLNE